VAASGAGGVFLLGDDESRELLLSGEQLGLAIDENSLTFLADTCLQPTEGGRRCIYETPLALVRLHGAKLSPFSVGLWSDIARLAIERSKSFGGALPATRQELADFVSLADTAAQEKAGTALPKTIDGVDDLFSQISYDTRLSEDGRVLLAALLAEAFLSEGAEWVPRSSTPPAQPGASGWEAANRFAVGIHPLAVVHNALTEEGWYQPARSIFRQKEGRTLLLGGDPKALRDAVRAREGAEKLEDLVKGGKVAQLAPLLTKYRSNRYLRGDVYRRLAAYGHEESLSELAGLFAAATDAEAIDHIALAAARLSRPLPAGEVDELIAGLRSAIEKEPGESASYLLLGAAYEKTTLPDRLRYARASYRKAQELMSWGHVGTAAKAALERLEGEE
jgi:hypothetical protein